MKHPFAVPFDLPNAILLLPCFGGVLLLVDWFLLIAGPFGHQIIHGIPFSPILLIGVVLLVPLAVVGGLLVLVPLLLFQTISHRRRMRPAMVCGIALVSIFIAALDTLFAVRVLRLMFDSRTVSEVVMSKGMKITARSGRDSIAITAGEGLMRSYTWDGATRSVKMWRRQKRWDGSLGLYYLGMRPWKPHMGISRGVLNEGQQHFATTDEALQWIRSRRYGQLVYRDDGLVVVWDKDPSSEQLTVDVWQVYVATHKPRELPGSDNTGITVSRTASTDSTIIRGTPPGGSHL